MLDLHKSGGLAALTTLRSHPDRLVRRRVAAILDLANGVPDAVELLQSAKRERQVETRLVADGLRPACTWIADARIERLIENALDEAARTFGETVRRTRASGEETHVSILFERLATAFARINDRLALYAAETEANERLEIRLEHRIVGKSEEGGAGVDTARFSADVCLLFEGWEAGRRFARRASLLQAKRIFVRQAALDVDYYPVDVSQLEDLASQTMAGFLLLVGPACEGVAMPVIPARLFLDMVERGESSGQIAPATASRLGKGIGAWLVEDVIGLWTGDWDEALVAKGKCGEGREPFLLVEITADRVRKGPDGWVR